MEDNLNFGLKKLVKKGVSDNITNIDNIKKTSYGPHGHKSQGLLVFTNSTSQVFNAELMRLNKTRSLTLAIKNDFLRASCGCRY